MLRNMTDPIIARGLTKRFGRNVAVKGVSFEVRKGEIFGFLGPNGAGKTTTARMLTGAIRPDDGSAVILDHDMAKEPVLARQSIGVVPRSIEPLRRNIGLAEPDVVRGNLRCPEEKGRAACDRPSTET
jgi:ABC-type multidrug transport system ATPase subunit